ncbi:MAG: DUF2846 domain-containing protein [Proteobacteria bacterium]|nr:DUF2846 domain-containing protein [Pseudomonadota bacterium]
MLRHLLLASLLFVSQSETDRLNEIQRGKLVIYRLNAFPSMRTPQLRIDGKDIGRPKEKTYIELDLPPGSHRIEVLWAKDTGWPSLDFQLIVQMGQVTYFKLTGSYEKIDGMTRWLGTSMEPIDPSSAAQEIATCCTPLKK